MGDLKSLLCVTPRGLSRFLPRHQVPFLRRRGTSSFLVKLPLFYAHPSSKNYHFSTRFLVINFDFRGCWFCFRGVNGETNSNGGLSVRREGRSDPALCHVTDRWAVMLEWTLLGLFFTGFGGTYLRVPNSSSIRYLLNFVEKDRFSTCFGVPNTLSSGTNKIHRKSTFYYAPSVPPLLHPVHFESCGGRVLFARVTEPVGESGFIG